MGCGGRRFGYNLREAPVAQWTEYLTSNQLVARSSRAGGARYLIGEAIEEIPVARFPVPRTPKGCRQASGSQGRSLFNGGGFGKDPGCAFSRNNYTVE